MYGTTFVLRIGQRFDTPHEQGCIVMGTPDLVGNFDALDSDGVLCSFSTVMVTKVYPDGDAS